MIYFRLQSWDLIIFFFFFFVKFYSELFSFSFSSPSPFSSSLLLFLFISNFLFPFFLLSFFFLLCPLLLLPFLLFFIFWWTIDGGTCDKKEDRRRLPWLFYTWAIAKRASLVVQWMKTRLPVQGTQVQILVREDATCCAAAKPVSRNYRSLGAQSPCSAARDTLQRGTGDGEDEECLLPR